MQLSYHLLKLIFLGKIAEKEPNDMRCFYFSGISDTQLKQERDDIVEAMKSVLPDPIIEIINESETNPPTSTIRVILNENKYENFVKSDKYKKFLYLTEATEEILQIMLSGKAHFKKAEYDYNANDRHLFVFRLTKSNYLDNDQLSVFTSYLQQKLIEDNLKIYHTDRNFVHCHSMHSLVQLNYDFQEAIKPEEEGGDFSNALFLGVKINALKGYPQDCDLIIIELEPDEYENYKKHRIKQPLSVRDITLGFIKQNKEKFSVEGMQKILNSDCIELIEKESPVTNLIATP